MAASSEPDRALAESFLLPARTAGEDLCFMNLPRGKRDALHISSLRRGWERPNLHLGRIAGQRSESSREPQQLSGSAGGTGIAVAGRPETGRVRERVRGLVRRLVRERVRRLVRERVRRCHHRFRSPQFPPIQISPVWPLILAVSLAARKSPALRFSRSR